MSEIQFKNLEIQNFLSIGEGDLALDNRGLLLIQGQNNDNPSANSNGAGKSSVVDALCWAIYGVTARGLSGDAVVNRFEGKNCRVSIKFALNAKTYEIQRHRKHTKGKNRLHFTVDGDDLTLGTDKLTQDLIEKTIGCNLEVFTASIYAAQDNMPNLPAMTDKELKQLVEKAAGIELLDDAYGIARERVRTASVIRDTAVNDHNTAVQQQTYAQQALDAANDQARQWSMDQGDRIEAEGKAVFAKMTFAKLLKHEIEAVDVAALEQKADALKAELAKPKSALPHIPDPELGVQLQPKAYPDPPPAIAESQREAGRLETLSDNAKLALKRMAQQVKDLNSTVGTPCDECGKPYCEDDLAERKRILMEQIQAKKAEYQDAQAEYELVIRGLRTLQEAHAHAFEEVRVGNELVKEQNDAVRQAWVKGCAEARAKREKQATDAAASDDSARIVAALSDVQRALSDFQTKRTSLAAKIEEVKENKRRLDDLKAQTNPHLPTIERAHNRLADCRNVVVETLKRSNDADEVLSDTAIAAELFSPKGMRGEILDSVTPFLNARTSQYLGVLSDGTITADWKTVGETGKGELREKFHIAVTNEHGAEVYEGNSGGEKRKVRVATAMALQDLVASRADRPIKLFIADEADDALDVSGLERLMTILDEKARSVGTVLVISHNDLGDWISNSVTVLKSGGKSHIIEV
jgi:DNA repair exonuclease SbcCD ATPase subunit